MAGSMRPGKRAGTWELRVELARDPLTRKRRWRSKIVTGSERQASRELARLVVEVGGLDLTDATGGTVAELFERWIKHIESRGRTRSTIYGYRTKWRLCSGSLGTLPVAATSPQRIDAVYTELQNRGVQAASIRHLHAMLRAMFEQARRWRMVSSNPVSDATAPPHHRPEPVAPTVEQVRALIGAAEDNEDLALAVYVRLSATLGTRRGETLAIRWSDIGDDAIRVDGAISVVADGRGAERKPTKTHASGEIPVDAGTLAMVEKLRLRARTRALSVGTTLLEDGFVFSDDADGERPWTPDFASKQFARLRAQVPGAEHVRLKDLRTYVATSLVDVGADVKTAQARLRHRSPQTTQQHYLARRKPAEERAAEQLGAALDG